MIEFWGLSCAPCLKTQLPKLMKFADLVKDDDRVRIVTVCCDIDKELNSIKELQKRLRPVVQHVWGGKELKLPIVLDSSFKTWERYGLPGLGAIAVVDPEGKLVGDNLEMLMKEMSLETTKLRN